MTEVGIPGEILAAIPVVTRAEIRVETRVVIPAAIPVVIRAEILVVMNQLPGSSTLG